MKKIGLILVIIAAMGIALLPKGVAKAATTITTCDQLQDMNLNLAEDYVLGSDIDCSATSGWNAGAGFDPVGDSGARFTGTLNGQGHKIIDLFIDRPSTNSIGLFGYVQNASVQNVTFQGASITGQYRVGTVAGVAESINLQNISSNVYVTSTDNTDFNGAYVGGILGYNNTNDSFATTLTNVHFTGIVVAADDSWSAGGLIGENGGNATITNSSNTGSVSGGDSTDYVGGLVGETWGATLNIINSFNSGNVSAKGNA